MGELTDQQVTMSDDEFMSSFEALTSTQTEESVEEPETADDPEEEFTDDVEETETSEEDNEEHDEQLEGSEEPDESEVIDQETDEAEDPAEEVDDNDEPDEADNSDEPDYKAAYEKVFGTFKANGRDMQVKSPEEAIQLMQMGANYQKKMLSLKPGLKTLKLLQNHDLLEPEKVSLMIDAAKGDKAAITQLIKSSGLDPLDVDVEAESTYQPKQYSVDDRELVLDDVVDQIKDTPTYSQTINLVGKTWDDTSRKIVAENPHLLQVLNDQIGSGIYDQVSAEVERERVLGRLNGLSDIEAYRKVGEDMDKRGAFKAASPAPAQAAPAPQRKVVTKNKATSSGKTAAKKRAASPARNKAGESNELKDALKLSDAEFLAKYGI